VDGVYDETLQIKEVKQISPVGHARVFVLAGDFAQHSTKDCKSNID